MPENRYDVIGRSLLTPSELVISEQSFETMEAETGLDISSAARTRIQDAVGLYHVLREMHKRPTPKKETVGEIRKIKTSAKKLWDLLSGFDKAERDTAQRNAYKHIDSALIFEGMSLQDLRLRLTATIKLCDEIIKSLKKDDEGGAVPAVPVIHFLRQIKGIYGLILAENGRQRLDQRLFVRLVFGQLPSSYRPSWLGDLNLEKEWLKKAA